MQIVQCYQVNLRTSKLENICFQASPHFDNRPDPQDISLIVVHGISLPPSQFGTGAIEQFFCGNLDFRQHAFYQTIKDLKVSSHLLISREGKITQFVPFSKRAWHAGKSSFQGREQCNDFSIGIELEGTDEIPYEEVQYQRLAQVIKALRVVYPKISNRIVGHSDIAPGRKTDPGASFDWEYLWRIVNMS